MGADLVEVKSCNDFKVHSAMNKIGKVEGWKYEHAAVFCKGNVENGVTGMW